MSLIKSKERVADHGEVFTPPWMVEAMLDLVKGETERIDSRFLASGTVMSAIRPRHPLRARCLQFGHPKESAAKRNTIKDWLKKDYKNN
jgi:hypothetical protein